MTFIDWSDSEEMLGLLSDYVLDEKSDLENDDARRMFLSELSAELADLAGRAGGMSIDEAIDGLRAVLESQIEDFAGDPVLDHVEACIEELERIRTQRSTN